MLPDLYFMVGISGSGKSTIAEEFSKTFNAEIFSSDTIRFELYGDENIQDNPQKVFQILHKRLKEALKKGKSVIYDATNLSMKRRVAFLKEIDSFNVREKICIIVNTPFEECISRNEMRKRKVPYSVLKKQRVSFQCPYYYEGWDRIIISNYNMKNFGNLESTLNHLMEVPHDNPNHSFTIGEHMKRAERYCTEKAAHLTILANDKNEDEDIKEALLREADQWCNITFAAKYHDIGKEACKSFVNKKGEITKTAHYYGHQNVSAYMVLSHLSYSSYLYGDAALDEEDKIDFWLKTVVLIQWHMEHYIRTGESLIKFKNLIGKEMVELLDKLHEADKAAH